MTSTRRSSRLSILAAVSSTSTSVPDDDDAGPSTASSAAQNLETKNLRIKIKKCDIEEILVVHSDEDDKETARKRRRILSSSSTVNSDSDDFVFEDVKIETDTSFVEVRKPSVAKQKKKTAKNSKPKKKNILKNKNTQEKQVSVKKEPKFNDSKNDENMGLTAFEALRQKNIQERMRLFQELQLGEAKEEVEKDLKLAKAKKPMRPSKVSIDRPKEVLPRRKSLRIEGIKAEEIAEGPRPSFRYSAPSMSSYGREWGDKPRTDKEVLPMSEVMLKLFTEDNCQHVMSNCCEKLEETIEPNRYLQDLTLKDFKSNMDHLSLKDEHKLKVVPTRIYSMAFHPNYNGALLAAGCKSGAVGVWNASMEAQDPEEQLVTFNYHVKPTSCVGFSEAEPHILYTTSYDGTVRRGDLHQQTFSLVHSTPEDERANHLGWHCELSPGVLLVAQGNGCIAKVDVREPDSQAEYFKCYDRSVRTISLHPVTKQHIVTTSSTRLVSIWDLRKMEKTISHSGKLSQLSFNKALSAAFFSPITGNKILTTSYDDNISVYSCTDLSAPTLDSQIHHNNHTGRWITNFKV